MEKRGTLCLIVTSLLLITHAQPIPEENKRVDFDDFEEHVQFPVPFGHITLEGFEDPTLGLRQPIDLLEFSMRKLRNLEEAKQLLNSKRKNTVQVIYPPRLSPRDEYIYNISDVKKSGSNVSAPLWYNFAATQLRNVQLPPSVTRQRPPQITKADDEPHPSFLSKNKFDSKDPYVFNDEFDFLSNRKENQVNWTTCQEFGNGTFFYPRDVVDIDWVPFYIWSDDERRMTYATIHKFSHPTQKFVKEYHDVCFERLNRTVDWQQPKLRMNAITEMLLIAVNKRGQFVGIFKPNVPDSLKDKPDILVPSVTVRLKMFNSHLMMMFCDGHYAFIMAVSGQEPNSDEDKIGVAANTGFLGTGKPVSRDLKEEKMRILAEKRQKEIEQENRILKTHEVIPLIMGQ